MPRIDRLAAFGAGEKCAEIVTAILVPVDDRRPFGTGVVGIAPMHERKHERIQIQPLHRKAILEAPGAFLVRHLLQHAIPDQASQPLGEHAPGDAQPAVEVLEPTDFQERVAQDEKRPAVADDRERTGERAELGREFIPFHAIRLPLT